MSVGYNPKIVSNGLIYCLDAANVKSYPGTGTVWTDLIRQSVGTITNSPTFSSSDAGGAFAFSAASSQFVDVNIDLDNVFSAGITMQAWIKVPSYVGFNRILTVRDAAGTGYTYFIQISSTTGVIQFGTAAGQFTNGLTAVGTNTWVNVAGTCTYGASSIKIYLNGIDNTGSATGTPAYTANVGSLYIARLTTNYSNITLSNAQIYNRALTEQEILQNYNALKGRFI